MFVAAEGCVACPPVLIIPPIARYTVARPMLRLGLSVGVLCATCSALGGCSAAPGADAATKSEAQAAAVTTVTSTPVVITFSSDWTQVASGPLVAGQPVAIAYDPARLVSQCGGSVASASGSGGFAWGITGYYAIGGAAPTSFQVRITSAWASGNAQITPPGAGDLQMWFGCSNTTGNGGWDSNYGGNYRFTVQPTNADAGTATGTVVVHVVGDAVQGSAGSVPPDVIVSTPIAGALVYDGPWEAGPPLGPTDANGDYTATLSIGVHSIGVMMVTTGDSMFSSDGNAVTVTSRPSTLVVHVVPDTLSIETSYGAGWGNAIYVTGETASLGNWQTAYKATYDPSTSMWRYTGAVPAGAQLKLLLAPWVDAGSIPVGSSHVSWEVGPNHVAPRSYYSVLDLSPSF